MHIRQGVFEMHSINMLRFIAARLYKLSQFQLIIWLKNVQIRIPRSLLLTVLAVLSHMPFANAEEMPLEPVDASISLSSLGRVEGVQCNGYIVQELCTTLTSAAKRWEFAPATRHGQPVASIIDVRFKLTGIADGDSYLIRIDSIQDYWIAINVPTKIVKPRYPLDAQRLRAGARVHIRAEIDANGEPGSTRVASIIGTGTSRRFEKTFKASALQAVRQWRYRAYKPDGEDRDYLSVTCIPINFMPHGMAAADFDKELHQKIKEEKWTDQQIVNPCGIMLPSSFERARLKTKLAGTML